jgi:hypothetical protein
MRGQRGVLGGLAQPRRVRHLRPYRRDLLLGQAAEQRRLE